MQSNSNTYFYNDPLTNYSLTLNPTNNCIIYITAVAGGGAGGVGFINNLYYFSGGGGGAGSCMIKKPIIINETSEQNSVYTIEINVGRGGDQQSLRDGTDTVICINKTLNGIQETLETLILKGGKNAMPNTDTIYKIQNNIITTSDIGLDNIISGGQGGLSSCYELFNGKNGKDGEIGMPSLPRPQTGEGGKSIYSNNSGSGLGGGNYFTAGGKGGNVDVPLGTDGKIGGGGGGSIPKSTIDYSSQLSGNGGNGLVIIEIAYS